MPSQRINILAREILKHFQHTASGHCARVDFLPREEAQAICQHLQTLEKKQHLRVYVLANKQQTISDNFTITIDYAIELRNRKEEKLCLFIPTDVVDATASSLSNAFAVIDGRMLYDSLLRQLRLKLSEKGQKVVQGVFGQLLGVLKISKEQQLSFISAVLEREEQGQLDLVGLELWRVGLIVDGRTVTGSSETTFLDFLDNNKRCVRALVHPTRLQASLSARLQSLLVDDETERKLQTFFRGKILQDVSNWSQALIEHKLTFER